MLNYIRRIMICFILDVHTELVFIYAFKLDADHKQQFFIPAEKLSQIISNSFLRDGTTVGTSSIGKYAFGSA